MPRLVYKPDPDSPEVEYELRRDRTTLGRIPQVDLYLGYPTVGQRHATVHCVEDVAFLTCVGSANAVVLNGNELKRGEPTQLADGDEFYLGEARLVYRA
jgi:pSer/pThr/pTyr-binding forkhead associated (FHA) protein